MGMSSGELPEREPPEWLKAALSAAAEQMVEQMISGRVPQEEMRWTRQISYTPGWQPRADQWALVYTETYTIPRWARRSPWLAWPVGKAQRIWAWTKIVWLEQRDFWGHQLRRRRL